MNIVTMSSKLCAVFRKVVNEVEMQPRLSVKEHASSSKVDDLEYVLISFSIGSTKPGLHTHSQENEVANTS